MGQKKGKLDGKILLVYVVDCSDVWWLQCLSVEKWVSWAPHKIENVQFVVWKKKEGFCFGQAEIKETSR
jgi:hypothetical protein